MVAALNIDIIFVVMLGAAIWTSLQLCGMANCSTRRISVRKLIEVTTAEGIVCALVWAAINLATTRSLTVELVTQSLLISCVWIVFSFAARLPFRYPASVTK